MEKQNRRNLIVTSLSQFGMTLSANFILAIMPFFILKVSPYSPQKTLVWVGLIMGITHLITAVASNFWGYLTSWYSPRLLYIRGLIVHTIAFFIMGFTSSLHLIFILRLIQGLMGGVSTIGLIIVSASSTKEKISADIGFFQAFLTLGFLLGPPLGSFAASVFGYRIAFVTAAALLMVVIFFCQLYLTDVLPHSSQEKSTERTINRRSVLGWFLCFSSTVQLMFLPSILPKILEQFHIVGNEALRWAGSIIMLYTASATLGIYFWTRIARRFGRDRMISMLVLVGTFFLVLLYFCQGIVAFIVVRMIHTGFIAAIVPLVISVFAGGLKGGSIGFMNSGRFAGNALGAIIATSVFAYLNIGYLYLVMTAMTLLALLGFKLSHATKGGAAQGQS